MPGREQINVRRPMALLVAQALVLLFTAVSVLSLVGSIRFTAAFVERGGAIRPYLLPLVRHYLYGLVVVGGLVTALFASVRRYRWARVALATVLAFGVIRLGIELAWGFADTPSVGPVPGNYYLRTMNPTEALGQSVMNAFMIIGISYLTWRLATGPDIKAYFIRADAGQQRDEPAS